MNKTMFSFNIDVNLKKRLLLASIEMDKKMGPLINEIMTDYLEKVEKVEKGEKDEKIEKDF